MIQQIVSKYSKGPIKVTPINSEGELVVSKDKKFWVDTVSQHVGSPRNAKGREFLAAVKEVMDVKFWWN